MSFSLGKVEHLVVIKKHYRDELVIRAFEGQSLVFKKLSLIQGSSSNLDSAIRSVCHFFENSQLSPDDLESGFGRI